MRSVCVFPLWKTCKIYIPKSFKPILKLILKAKNSQKVFVTLISQAVKVTKHSKSNHKEITW